MRQSAVILDPRAAQALIVACAEGVEPTSHVSERARQPAVLWREGSPAPVAKPGSRDAERLLTVVGTVVSQDGGLHLVTLPPYCRTLQMAERLWPLGNEPFANRAPHAGGSR